jgi:hypothetical protein
MQGAQKESPESGWLPLYLLAHGGDVIALLALQHVPTLAMGHDIAQSATTKMPLVHPNAPQTKLCLVIPHQNQWNAT